MKNLKTTSIGILTIVVAIGGAALAYLQHGTMPDFTTLTAAVAAGIGLITARDSKPTDLTPTEQTVLKQNLVASDAANK